MATTPAAGRGTATGRARLEQQREQELQQARRRKALWAVAAVVALVLVMVAVLWGTGRSKREEQAKEAVPAGAELAYAVTHIDAKTFDAVGAGTAQTGIEPLSGATAQKVDGKPRVWFVGAEYCPFCAGERLALSAALSRFGTLDGLKDSVTPQNEGSIPAVVFLEAKFTSDHLVFNGYEVADANGKPLQKLSAEDEKTFSSMATGYPFSHYGTAISKGAGVDVRILSQQKNADLAAKLSDPNAPETRSIVGEANIITAQICRETGNKPADVCSSAGVAAAASKLK